jgi:tetratricopeptide (TPR) repeat protein
VTDSSKHRRILGWVGLHASLFVLPVLPSAQGCFDSSPSVLFEQSLDSALADAQNLNYSDARRLFQTPVLKSTPLGLYFQGLAELQAAEDLGDTAAFYRADSLWPRIMKKVEFEWKREKFPVPENDGKAKHPPSGEVKTEDINLSQPRVDSLIWALSAVQWAGTQQKLGHSWRAVKLGLKARKPLQTLQDCPEARAALALLNYYRDQILPGWLPLTTSPEASAKTLEEALSKCRRMHPVFLSAWIWTQFDLARWKMGLAAIDTYLESYPTHRLFLQMRGDFLFRQGQLEKALIAYERVLSLYPSPSREPENWHGVLPLGYLSCAGNLARIEAALNHKDKALTYLNIWEDKAFTPARPWLPASLKSALSGLRERIRSQ